MGKLIKRIRKIISPYYRYVEMRFKIICYNLRRQRIISDIKGRKKVRVAFFVVNLSMWRCDSLFRLMLDHPRYEPFIVPMPRPMFNQDAEKQEQIRLIDYCIRMNYPYIPGYDYDLCSFNSYDEIKPDIVFFCQPYNDAFPAHKIEAFWKRCLFYYVPYCILVEKSAVMTDTLYTNICQNVFLENDILKDVLSPLMTNGGSNILVSGYLSAEKLTVYEESDMDVWKNNDPGFKRIIWAPHHSILKKDILNYSLFLQMADVMLEIARKYQDTVQFAFKPHPGLKPKLYDMEGWGRQRTDEYYSAWEQMPNTVLIEGSYESLFRSSDAMIHDCSSFSVEYLLTGKPVLFLTKADHIDYLNELGVLCFNMHYKANSADEICSFIEESVLKGHDPMKAERDIFVKDKLMPFPTGTAAQRIIAAIDSQLKTV